MTKKVRYGLRAMIEINLNDTSLGILQKDISANQDIPLKFLDSIITDLRNASLIVNFSGKRSGYVLSKRPEEISVYDIYRAFEPELTIVNCTCPTNECERVNICPATDYWFDLNNEIKSKMTSFTLDRFITRN